MGRNPSLATWTASTQLQPMAQHILSFCLSTLWMATTLHAQSDLSVAIQQETAGYDATLNVT